MNELSSLVFYLTGFLIASVLIHLGSKKKNRIITSIGILIPTLIGGLRYMVGADFHSYNEKMKVSLGMGMWEFADTFNNMEPSLWLIGRLSHSVFDSGILFFVLTSFMTVLFFYLGAKRFNTPHIGLFMLLILLIIFPQSLSGVRQGVAIAISFYAFSFIGDKKLFKFIAMVLLACLFHYSALVMLVIYPLYTWAVEKSKNSTQFLKKSLIIVIATPLLVTTGLYVIQFIPILDKYALYYTKFLDHYEHLAGTHNILPELSALMFVVIFFKHIIIKTNTGMFSFIMVILMSLTTLLGLFLPLAGRFSDYFMPMFLLTLPNLIDLFSNRKLRKLATIAVIIYALAFFVGAFYIKGSGRIFPYNSILF